MGDADDPRFTVRLLTADQLSDVSSIDMREHDDILYRVVDGRLQAYVETWNRLGRSLEAWERHIEAWKEYLQDDGQAWGAFDAQRRMVGIVVLRHRLTDEMDQLAALFVSRDHRRTGIASQLVHRLILTTRASGARRLYVSATPSRSAVGFYRSQGFVLADKVYPELFAREPEEIHMVLSL
jgi:GNAT superfamily N-acetyltransferase